MEGEQNYSDKVAPEILLKCEMCEYSYEINITLKRNKNTKHEVHNCDTYIAQFKT